MSGVRSVREACLHWSDAHGLEKDSLPSGVAGAQIVRESYQHFARTMLDLVRTGFFKANETILFLHTGGQPALFAEQYADEFK